MCGDAMCVAVARRACELLEHGEQLLLGGQPVRWLFSLSTRVRILFLVPIAAGMVGACKIQGHSRTRAVLPRATILARTSAHEPCEHKVYRGLGGAPQERLPLHGRRGPTRPSTLRLGWAAFDAVMPCRLWLLGWRDADASLCSGLLAAMPRRLGRQLERNSAGRCDCCAPECWRHRLSRCVWCYFTV